MTEAMWFDMQVMAEQCMDRINRSDEAQIMSDLVAMLAIGIPPRYVAMVEDRRDRFRVIGTKMYIEPLRLRLYKAELTGGEKNGE